MSLDPSSAGEALAAAQESRQRFVLTQAHWPWSRHAAFGVILGALAAAQALPMPLNVVADSALAIAAVAVAGEDRRKRGVFVNGWRWGRTLWIALPTLLLATALGLLGLWLSLERGLAWAPPALGAALVVPGALASKAWELVYRRELQESL